MNTHVTTAILDMHEPLNGQRKRTLEEALLADAGVLSVGSPGHLPRLLMVAYNAALTSSSRISKRVSGAGQRAHIVGCA